MRIARSLNLACLVEVHTEEDLHLALEVDAAVIGINNRDMKPFHTDLSPTFRLRECIPSDKIVVSESGIYTRDDVEKLKAAGINAILVGESLMRSADIGCKVRELIL